MKRRKAQPPEAGSRAVDTPLQASGSSLRVRQLLFFALVFFCLLIPSSWTQEVFKQNREADKQAIKINGFGVDYSTIETRAKHDLSLYSEAGAA